jgi:hypothetical protein
VNRLKDEYLTALDVSVITLHWLARQWARAAPGVATQIRRIADTLARKAKRIRERGQD